MSFKRLFCVFFLAIVLSCVVNAAVSLEGLDISPAVVWLNDDGTNIDIRATCKYDGEPTSTATVTARISPLNSGMPSTSALYYQSSTEKYVLNDFSFPFTAPGTYQVNVTCERDGERASIVGTIVAQELELDIIKEDEYVDGYMGDYLTLKVDFRVDDGGGSKIIPPPQGAFGISIGDDFEIDDVSQEDIRVVGSQYQSLTLSIPDDPDDADYLSSGIYDLEVTGRYSAYGKTATLTKKERSYVRINPALKVTLPEEKIECIAGDVCKKEIDALVAFPIGDIDDFTTENFEAVVVNKNAAGRKIYASDVVCNKDTRVCKLTLDIPALDPGLYDLFVTAASPSISSYDYMNRASMPLAIVLELSGEVKDASGGIIETKFTLENKNSGEIISGSTDTAGTYKINVIPGDYEIGAKFFGGVSTKFSDVRISPGIGALGTNFIRYDRDNINSRGPGTRIVKIAVVEFALPFEEMWMYVPYDSSKVNGNEEMLTVHNCIEWNFKKRVCNGEWVELEKEIHTIQDSLEFRTNLSGAFVIGEKRSMSVTDVEVKTEKVYIGEVVNVIGRVIDSDSSPVEDVEVEVSFPRFGISMTTLTKAGGLFSADIEAPYAEGPVDMIISVMNGQFSAANYTKSVDVLRKKELSITGIPDMVDVDVDSVKTVRFKLVNTGQTNLTKPVYVHVSGISSDWYSVLPLSINSIMAGEQKDVDLKLRLTSGLCGGACPAFSLVTIEAKSDEISKSTSFTLRINQPNAPTNNTGGNVTGGDLYTPPQVTGFVTFVPNVSFDTNYLLLTVIVVLLFLVVSKKQARRGGSRSNVVESLHKIKAGI